MLLMAQHDSLVSLSETLDQPSLDHHVQSQSEPTNSPASTAAAAAVAVAAADQSQSFSRNASFGRLNAQAPEFVPRTSSSSPSSSSAMTQPRVLIPPPPPPGLVHMYHAPNSPFHVPIPGHGVAVPVQNNHLYAHHVPVQYHHQHHPHPHHHRQSHPQHRQYYGGAGSNSAFVDQQEVASVQTHAQQAPQVDLDQVGVSRNGLSEEATQKILNQVEYYFSDVNLATTDHLMRFIHKDPEGYVPISVVASFKKIKAFTCNNSQLASILRNSQKLAVSEDGKKVRRQHPLTESDMEELQSRIVVAENLPEDHCHQNLMKIFSAVGSVKSIRTCQPQTSNGGTSSASRTTKAEGMLFYNKLHAFVEYESVELAEKAIADLNDEGNWRNGLRVRLLLRRTTKSGQSRVKTYKEDDASTSEQQQPNQKHLEDLSQQSEPLLNDHAGEEHGNEEGVGQRKGRNRGRGGRGGRGRPHNHRGNQHAGVAAASSSSSPASNSYVNGEVAGKQPPPGPRMPDGTRGFSMGRGKPIAA